MFFDSPQNATALSVTTAAAITSLDDPSFVGFTITPTNGKVYYGASGVTTANGQPLESGQSMTIATKTPKNFFVIADTGTVAVRLTLYRGHR
ncbi:MAG: hypothetical protein VW405_06220 [Rhodospirillaceae bacterium]